MTDAISADDHHPFIRLQEVPTYEAFLRDHLLPNRPCILPIGMTKGWTCLEDWSLSSSPSSHHHQDPATPRQASDDDGRVDWKRLAKDYGDHLVPVVIRGPLDEGGDGVVEAGEGEEQGEQEQRFEMELSKAVDLILAGRREEEQRSRGDVIKKVYIKDWHLVRLARSDLGASARSSLDDHPEERRRRLPYSTPHIFKDDWMNSHSFRMDDWEDRPRERPTPTRGHDDFRFCYAGVKGTRTGIHCDVYGSYSWSTNVVGRKVWRFFPPRVAYQLRRFPNERRSEVADSVESMDRLESRGLLGKLADGRLGWEAWPEARSEMVEVIQEVGETIFVPSGWYHEVENLSDCVSLNHNWCNSINLVSMYGGLKEAVEDVERSLEDVREMIQARHRIEAGRVAQKEDEDEDEDRSQGTWKEEWFRLVQDVVGKDSGWDWQGFWSMVRDNLLLLLRERSGKEEEGGGGEHEPEGIQQKLRPPLEFVLARVRGLLDDFVVRHDYPHLSQELRSCVQECNQAVSLLERSA